MARIAELRVAAGRDFVSAPVDVMQLALGGIAGDLHAGATRRADARTPWHKRGGAIANTRQVSIVSVEECAAVAAALALDGLDAGLIGANLVLEGIAGLTGLMPSTRLQFPSGATLFVTEENKPCRQAGRALAAAHGRAALEWDFVTAAAGRRGVVALVERAGELRCGDAVRVIGAGFR